MSHSALAGLYRMSRIGLVTPLRDGMNLVAKEYVAAQVAGAAQECCATTAHFLQALAHDAEETRQAWPLPQGHGSFRPSLDMAKEIRFTL